MQIANVPIHLPLVHRRFARFTLLFLNSFAFEAHLPTPVGHRAGSTSESFCSPNASFLSHPSGSVCHVWHWAGGQSYSRNSKHSNSYSWRNWYKLPPLTPESGVWAISDVPTLHPSFPASRGYPITSLCYGPPYSGSKSGGASALTLHCRQCVCLGVSAWCTRLHDNSCICVSVLLF